MESFMSGALDVKAYLSRALALEEEILAKAQEAGRIRRLARGLRTDTETEAVSMLENIEKGILKDVCGFNIAYKRIQTVIDSVRRPEDKVLLRYRYLCGKKWEDIAETMNYGLSQVHRIHNRALREIRNGMGQSPGAILE